MMTTINAIDLRHGMTVEVQHARVKPALDGDGVVTDKRTDEGTVVSVDDDRPGFVFRIDMPDGDDAFRSVDMHAGATTGVRHDPDQIRYESHQFDVETVRASDIGAHVSVP